MRYLRAGSCHHPRWALAQTDEDLACRPSFREWAKPLLDEGLERDTRTSRRSRNVAVG